MRWFYFSLDKPNEKALDKSLSADHIPLGPLNGGKQILVLRLLKVFHNVGVASLVLRFVHPHHFGVFSTPVLHLVQVNRGDTVELYLAARSLPYGLRISGFRRLLKLRWPCGYSHRQRKNWDPPSQQRQRRILKMTSGFRGTSRSSRAAFLAAIRALATCTNSR
jgi:hypothetical protein